MSINFEMKDVSEMSTIEVFDPAMCCGSGVCGTDVEQRLVDFQAAIKTVENDEISVMRHNLANDPKAFAQRDVVKSFLDVSGVEGLPVIVVNGVIVLSGRYPTVEEMRRWANSGETAGSTPRFVVTERRQGGCCGGGRTC